MPTIDCQVVPLAETKSARGPATSTSLEPATDVSPSSEKPLRFSLAVRPASPTPTNVVSIRARSSLSTSYVPLAGIRSGVGSSRSYR
jgi:hypothetical protein